jgi:ParB family chromosome partitioning protein
MLSTSQHLVPKEVLKMYEDVRDDSSNDELVDQVVENQSEEHCYETENLPLDLIEPDPDQPRKTFDDEKIRELAASIESTSLQNPILVTRIQDGKFRIISGENRYRAFRLLGRDSIPSIIREVDRETSFRMQLAENLVRSDLNPIEEARAFQRLVEEFHYTHQQLAESLGKSREYVTKKLGLLRLDEEVQHALQIGEVTEGAVRPLIPLDEENQVMILRRISEDDLSAREVEQLVRGRRDGTRGTSSSPEKMIHITSLEIYSILFDDNGDIVESLPVEVLVRAILRDLKMMEGS